MDHQPWLDHWVPSKRPSATRVAWSLLLQTLKSAHAGGAAQSAASIVRRARSGARRMGFIWFGGGLRVKGALARSGPGFYKRGTDGRALHADPAQDGREEPAALSLR